MTFGESWLLDVFLLVKLLGLLVSDMVPARCGLGLAAQSFCLSSGGATIAISGLKSGRIVLSSHIR